jgi:DNA-directed RNA polymerase sigma subunit (sigma70/sigma32)
MPRESYCKDDREMFLKVDENIRNEILDDLPTTSKYKQVILMINGVGWDGKKTYASVAKQIGLSAPRISQIERKAYRMFYRRLDKFKK